jgi:hypothetical protein
MYKTIKITIEEFKKEFNKYEFFNKTMKQFEKEKCVALTYAPKNCSF